MSRGQMDYLTFVIGFAARGTILKSCEVILPRTSATHAHTMVQHWWGGGVRDMCQLMLFAHTIVNRGLRKPGLCSRGRVH